MGQRFHLEWKEDQEAIDTAIAAYFADNPELNPERVSVELRPTSTGGYEAVGYKVVDMPGIPAVLEERKQPTTDQLAEDAFTAYAAQLSHTNHTMDVAEGWSNQGDEIRAGFLAAAAAVRDRIAGVQLPAAQVAD